MTYVLIDDSLNPGAAATLIDAPDAVIAAWEAEEAMTALAQLDEAVTAGFCAAGFLSYEFGYLTDSRTVPLLPANRDVPLLWFALCRKPKTVEAAAWLESRVASGGGYAIGDVVNDWDRAAYVDRCRRVIALIEAGDVYQANLTFKGRFSFSGDPAALYAELRRCQPNAYGGFVHTPAFSIASCSPELFLERRDGRIVSRPMKGTAPRGLWPIADLRQKDWLREDPKCRAENLMIVDLVRNDLGRVARTGSVRVDTLFEIETYSTLHQMTSQVSADLTAGAGLIDVLRAVFPPGSVTGAPKIRAMEIIRELEDQPRGAYCGALGLLGPGNHMRLNVAIRTVTIRDGHGEIGIGSGVVADSIPHDEYDECVLKRRFLNTPAPRFALIETLRLDAGGYAYLEEHLARLRTSAGHLGFRADMGAVADALAQTAGQCDGPRVVRLTLERDGRIDLTSRPLAESGAMRVAISNRRVRSDNPFLYHKTTLRDLYDGELARLSSMTGCDEVLFLNERGEVCEGSRTNVFVQKEKGGVLLTPALKCGLLPGTLRARLLAQGGAREAVLHHDDLTSAHTVFVGNSVRGLAHATVVPGPSSVHLPANSLLT